MFGMKRDALLFCLGGAMSPSEGEMGFDERWSPSGSCYVQADPVNFNNHLSWTSIVDGATFKGRDAAADHAGPA